MEYISVAEAASRWGVNARVVQTYCAAGRIPGACRLGRAWMIPSGASKPDDPRRAHRLPAGDAQPQPIPGKLILPLMAARYEPGRSAEYAARLSDPESRQLALAERLYYRGEAEQALSLSAPLCGSGSARIRTSAELMRAFALISSGRAEDARLSFSAMASRPESDDAEERALLGFVRTLSSVLLHLDGDAPVRPVSVSCLPTGIKLIACYVMAHKKYLEGSYQQAVGIAGAALTMADGVYPVAMIYLHLIMTMAHMSLMDAGMARIHFCEAWRIAAPDGFLEPFGEHHGLLLGMTEVCLRGSEPEQYDKIIAITYRFAEAWRFLHRERTGESVAGMLTAMEFTIAMLASKGWRNQEISAYIGLSVSSVKSYISSVYQKLSISSRRQLRDHMLR